MSLEVCKVLATSLRSAGTTSLTGSFFDEIYDFLDSQLNSTIQVERGRASNNS